MSKAYESTKSNRFSLDFTYLGIMRSAGYDDRFAADCCMHLLGRGLLETDSLGSCRLTEAGIYKWERTLRLEKLNTDWRRLNVGDANSQQRGHEFEHLVAELGELDGAQALVNARAPGEENDVVLRWGGTYFIVSCKWCAEPSGMPDLRDLRDRVKGRHDVVGVLASVGGFTKDVVNSIESESLGLIVPIGRADIEMLLAGEVGFQSLLIDRRGSILIHRRAVIP
jgi:hypothetical protein